MWSWQGWGLLWLEVALLSICPSLCHAGQTGQSRCREGGEAMVETEKGKYGAVVYCRESLGKTEDNLLGIFEGPPLSGFCGWLQLLRRPGAARQEETPQR